MLSFAILVAAASLATAPAPTVTAAVAAEDAGKKIRCRKTEVTGTLAGFRKECRTVAEWQSLDDANREAATKIQDRGLVIGCGSAPSGC